MYWNLLLLIICPSFIKLFILLNQIIVNVSSHEKKKKTHIYICICFKSNILCTHFEYINRYIYIYLCVLIIIKCQSKSLNHMIIYIKCTPIFILKKKKILSFIDGLNRIYIRCRGNLSVQTQAMKPCFSSYGL